MRWFEQVLSKPRWYLTQLHCPAMLKLVTVIQRPRRRRCHIIRSGHIRPLRRLFCMRREGTGLINYQEDLERYQEEIE